MCEPVKSKVYYYYSWCCCNLRRRMSKLFSIAIILPIFPSFFLITFSTIEYSRLCTPTNTLYLINNHCMTSILKLGISNLRINRRISLNSIIIFLQSHHNSRLCDCPNHGDSDTHDHDQDNVESRANPTGSPILVTNYYSHLFTKTKSECPLRYTTFQS
jgi:hypothetical protein